MIDSTVMTLMLVVANVFGAGMIVPQVVRLHRLRSSAGVSAEWVGVGLAMNAWWLAYGIAEGLWGILPVSALAGALYLVIAGQLRAIDGSPALRGLGRGLAVAGVGPAVALAIGGWGLAGLAVGLSYGIQFAPAAWSAWRSADRSGISATTWAMALVEAGIWLTYGRQIADDALIVGGGGGAVMALLILVRLVSGPRRAAPTGAFAPA